MCLRGLFDTDGGVNNLIHYTTVSKQLGLDITVLLLNLGIVSSLKELNGEAYRVQISGYDAHKFYKIVSFECPHKQKKLQEKYETSKVAKLLNDSLRDIIAKTNKNRKVA